MAEPHTCPRCDGERKVFNARSGQSENCPTCAGSGVVWDRGTEESTAVPAGDDSLDLTFRP